ncbi:hypothetical protein P5P86_13630 [Nocardioides sp. BP30]|uniref:hypothetical protein n=1 Tax=Nocardioides sp. BP30 TaxID=3036374 RepID=UPI002468B776|nr:hypothetical protein [Nocardioides sp. BP30]WGL51003.1 hypothetical protein P5P86_13630 [Nocardioides sp. BP30]
MRRLGSALAGAAAVALLLTGCGASTRGTAVPPALDVATGTTSTAASSAALPTSTAPASPIAGAVDLHPLSWGVDGDLLSLVVRNAGTRTVDYARVRITVLDRRGHVITRTTGATGSTCCTVVGLSPGKRFGLFVNLPHDAAAVGSVHLDVLPARRRLTDAPAPKLRVGTATLSRTSTDAVVTARFTAPASIGPYVAGQAFLTDRTGHLVAVISGRFYCFTPGATRVLRMQLLHPVPRGTRISAVLGYAVPRHSPVASPPVCHGA